MPASAPHYGVSGRHDRNVLRSILATTEGNERNVSMIVGSGDYRYQVNADWAKLPDGWSFKEVGGVGVDSHDNVYVFNRGVHPMMVFDREGNFLRSWGEGRIPAGARRPYGPRRHDVPHRRWRAVRAPVTLDSKGP